MLNPNSELGTVKVTLQKFYRVNGGSTQLRGVASDIALPDLFEYSKLREKDNPGALPWDEIPSAQYNRWKYGLELAPIKKASSERLKNNQAFNLIREKAQWLAKQDDKVYSLNLKKYQEEQKQINEGVKQIESLTKLTQELN